MARIDLAKRRLLTLRRGLALGSVAVFALAVGYARAADGHSTQTTRATQTTEDDTGSYWRDDDGSLGPAQSAPQAQTGQS